MKVLVFGCMALVVVAGIWWVAMDMTGAGAGVAPKLGVPKVDPVSADTRTGDSVGSRHERQQINEPVGAEPSVVGHHYIEPTEGQRNDYYLLTRLLGNFAVELPSEPEMSSEQWASMSRLWRDVQVKSAIVDSARGKLAMSIAKERKLGGQLELAQDGDGASKPSVSGQLVARTSENGTQYLIRINPGDSQELDALTAELSVIALDAANEARRILER